MLKIVVIADDLTGANGTGVLLRKSGLKACTLLDPEHVDVEALSEFDAVSFSTGSRSLMPGDAYARVQAVAERFKPYPVRRYAKRIDSTLRGNLGAETDALLDTLGDRFMAFVVPCFPSASRIHIGGYLLVSGVPLHRTDAADDPKNPVRTSRPSVLFAQQSRYPVATVGLEDLLEDEPALTEKLQAYHDAGIRTVVFDAVSETDIGQIAHLAVHSGIPFVAVDPGPFTAAVTAADKEDPAASHFAEIPTDQPADTGSTAAMWPQILLAIGSVCGVARRQLEILKARQELLMVTIQIGELVKGESERRAEVVRVRNEIAAQCHKFQVCCIVGCGIDPDQRVDFASAAACCGLTEDTLSERVNASIGEMVDLILAADCRFNALYTSGGDITVAVCRQLGAVGMNLVGEVLPLAAYGTLIKGRYEGMKMITKGGLAGNDDSLAVCVDYLLNKT